MKWFNIFFLKKKRFCSFSLIFINSNKICGFVQSYCKTLILQHKYILARAEKGFFYVCAVGVIISFMEG